MTPSLLSKSKPGRPRSDESRRAILGAAYDLVVKKGYANVTTDAIASQAGAGKQTIYRWWSGKADLVLDALEDWAERQINIIENDTLPAFLHKVCEGATRAGPVLRSLMAEAQFDEALRRQLRKRLIEPRREAMRRCLAHAGIAPHRCETLVMAIYGGLWYRLLMDEPLDAVFVERMTELAHDG